MDVLDWHTEVRKYLYNNTINAGRHYFNKPHLKYNERILIMWNDLFKNIDADKITLEMIEEFNIAVKKDPGVVKLMGEIMERGGMKCISKALASSGFKSAGKFVFKVIPIIGWWYWIADELFIGVPELY